MRRKTSKVVKPNINAQPVQYVLVDLYVVLIESEAKSYQNVGDSDNTLTHFLVSYLHSRDANRASHRNVYAEFTKRILCGV